MFRNPFAARRFRRAPRPRFRPKLEMLEERLTPASYSVNDLSNLPLNGYPSVSPYSMNDTGEVIGLTQNLAKSSFDIQSYSNGAWTPIPVPQNVPNFTPVGINNNGEILGIVNVGKTNNGWNEEQLYTSTGNTFTPVPIPVDQQQNPQYAFIAPNTPVTSPSFGVSLDDAGDILAFIGNANGVAEGAVYDIGKGGIWVTLPQLLNQNAPNPFPLSISHSGIVLATEENVPSIGPHQAYIFTESSLTKATIFLCTLV